MKYSIFRTQNDELCETVDGSLDEAVNEMYKCSYASGYDKFIPCYLVEECSGDVVAKVGFAEMTGRF